MALILVELAFEKEAVAGEHLPAHPASGARLASAGLSWEQEHLALPLANPGEGLREGGERLLAPIESIGRCVPAGLDATCW
jgi:hypothetical protein